MQHWIGLLGGLGGGVVLALSLADGMTSNMIGWKALKLAGLLLVIIYAGIGIYSRFRRLPDSEQGDALKDTIRHL